MSKKSLIMYASSTGNTESVALRFKKAFEKKGWECELFKVDKKTDKNLPFDYQDYDFLCLGSPVIFKLPTSDMQRILNPTHEGPPPPEVRSSGPKVIRFGFESKKGVVFATYSGHHLGPKEPDPALALLESLLEHKEFECVGRFACPGRMFDGTSGGWYKDINDRPNERDLQKAEIFMEEILEDLP